MRRWRKRLEEQALRDYWTAARYTESRRIPKEQAEEVLSLYRDKYFDLNVRHFQRSSARNIRSG